MAHLSLLLSRQAPSDESDGEPGVGYRVLVVAAGDFTRRFLVARLARAGFEVQAVAARADASIELTLAFVDAVVTDVDEPDPRIAPLPLVLTSTQLVSHGHERYEVRCDVRYEERYNDRYEERHDTREDAIVTRPCDVVDAVLEALWEGTVSVRTAAPSRWIR